MNALRPCFATVAVAIAATPSGLPRGATVRRRPRRPLRGRSSPAAASGASRTALEKTKPCKEPIVTEIVLAGPFYPAEDDRQNCDRKNPIRCATYRNGCGRGARLKQLWGGQAGP